MLEQTSITKFLEHKSYKAPHTSTSALGIARDSTSRGSSTHYQHQHRRSTKTTMTTPSLLLLFLHFLRLSRYPHGLGSVFASFPSLSHYQRLSINCPPNVLLCATIFHCHSNSYHHYLQDSEEYTLLPARLLNVGRLSIPYEPIERLEFLYYLIRIIDKRRLY